MAVIIFLILMFVLSPSKIARYFFLDCERFLSWTQIPKDERKKYSVPAPPYDHSPVTLALSNRGYEWERKVVEKILAGK
jgi:hypothetical protein